MKKIVGLLVVLVACSDPVEPDGEEAHVCVDWADGPSCSDDGVGPNTDLPVDPELGHGYMCPSFGVGVDPCVLPSLPCGGGWTCPSTDYWCVGLEGGSFCAPRNCGCAVEATLPLGCYQFCEPGEGCCAAPLDCLPFRDKFVCGYPD